MPQNDLGDYFYGNLPIKIIMVRMKLC